MIRIGEVAKFIDQVKQEAKRITWPDKKDLITSGSIVIVSVLIFSLITMLLDYTIHSLMDFLLNIGK
jgi:preprotein translocase subunit SecE